jgi:hypothetical protein
MAFLGVISLIGVIVSHVIVLFDFIEEQHEHGEPLLEALLDAGILRLRPVLVTVGATVLGLFPLAMHGGPLWEPLCFVQIGGLTIATEAPHLLQGRPRKDPPRRPVLGRDGPAGRRGRHSPAPDARLPPSFPTHRSGMTSRSVD